MLPFMSDGLLALLRVQDGVGSLLLLTSVAHDVLLNFFPNLATERVFAALQQMVMEILRDVFLRCTCEYTQFPYKLLCLLNGSTTPGDQAQIALDFLRLPPCCRPAHFDGVWADIFPSVEALLSEECGALLCAWGENHQLVTKTVEFGHRVAGAQAKPRGPAKPAEFRVVADGCVVNRFAVLHAEAVGRKRKSRPRLREHPVVQSIVGRVKKLGSKSKRRPRKFGGGNPKLAWLNEQRERLQKLGLGRDAFNAEVSRLAVPYDADPSLRQAALDTWRARHIARRAAAAMTPPAMAAPQQLPQGFGPWGLGDSYWPLSEERLRHFLLTNTQAGGIRQAALAHRHWQDQGCMVTCVAASSASKLGEDAPLAAACAHKHPGKCVGHLQAHELLKEADLIASGLHSIRPPCEHCVV